MEVVALLDVVEVDEVLLADTVVVGLEIVTEEDKVEVLILAEFDVDTTIEEVINGFLDES